MWARAASWQHASDRVHPHHYREVSRWRAPVSPPGIVECGHQLGQAALPGLVKGVCPKSVPTSAFSPSSAIQHFKPVRPFVDGCTYTASACSRTPCSRPQAAAAYRAGAARTPARPCFAPPCVSIACTHASGCTVGPVHAAGAAEVFECARSVAAAFLQCVPSMPTELSGVHSNGDHHGVRVAGQTGSRSPTWPAPTGPSLTVAHSRRRHPRCGLRTADPWCEQAAITLLWSQRVVHGGNCVVHGYEGKPNFDRGK